MILQIQILPRRLCTAPVAGNLYHRHYFSLLLTKATILITKYIRFYIESRFLFLGHPEPTPKILIYNIVYILYIHYIYLPTLDSSNNIYVFHFKWGCTSTTPTQGGTNMARPLCCRFESWHTIGLEQKLLLCLTPRERTGWIVREKRKKKRNEFLSVYNWNLERCVCICVCVCMYVCICVKGY